jgi:hypothetical protein
VTERAVPKDLASAVAAVVGSLPGLTLPFVAELVLGPRASDLLLLALSAGHHPVTDRQLGHRLPTVAEYGRLLGRRLDPTAAALRRYRSRVLRFAQLLTVVTPSSPPLRRPGPRASSWRSSAPSP